MYSTNISDELYILPLVDLYSAKMHDFFTQIFGLFRGIKLHKTAELADNQMGYLTRNTNIYIFALPLT